MRTHPSSLIHQRIAILTARPWTPRKRRPYNTAKHLVKGADLGTRYEGTTPEKMVEAVRALDALISGERVAKTG